MQDHLTKTTGVWVLHDKGSVTVTKTFSSVLKGKGTCIDIFPNYYNRQDGTVDNEIKELSPFICSEYEYRENHEKRSQTVEWRFYQQGELPTAAYTYVRLVPLDSSDRRHEETALRAVTAAEIQAELARRKTVYDRVCRLQAEYEKQAESFQQEKK